MKTFEARTRERWRQWLAKNHDSASEVWLIFHKKHTGTPSVAYSDALDEALCYGWIDSLVKRIDDARFARKFTPRKPESSWSSINIRRYNELKAAGKLAAPGLARSPDGRRVVDGPSPEDLPGDFAAYMKQAEKALKRDDRAGTAFEALPPSHRRRYLHWIAMAKRDTTRERRLREAIALLRGGKTLGLK
jgi:uncharacterized protein YdeI (YjbR/CyaY-like superfamily)